MRRIQRGPVHGISLKLQEEERERRMDFVPAKSVIDTEGPINVDQDTADMLKALKLHFQVNIASGRGDAGFRHRERA